MRGVFHKNSAYPGARVIVIEFLQANAKSAYLIFKLKTIQPSDGFLKSLIFLSYNIDQLFYSSALVILILTVSLKGSVL